MSLQTGCNELTIEARGLLTSSHRPHSRCNSAGPLHKLNSCKWPITTLPQHMTTMRGHKIIPWGAPFFTNTLSRHMTRRSGLRNDSMGGNPFFHKRVRLIWHSLQAHEMIPGGGGGTKFVTKKIVPMYEVNLLSHHFATFVTFFSPLHHHV